MAKEENAVATADTKKEEGLQQTDLERRVGAVAADLGRWMEAAL